LARADKSSAGGANSTNATQAGGEETQRLVLGTAGHIDHGKTSLVKVLTGVDTDRLPEEKARGITIDLGFAALDLGEGARLAIVDVPGHEKLVRTMVSGAAGIDLVLLVIAADEGVMPQTREHVAICDLLGIEHGVVALTKADLADEEMIELATEEARELLEQTALADAPIVAVSCETRSGIEDLEDVLRKLAGSAHSRTPRRGPARLGIDRSFAIRGFGTVVTGTLIGGALKVGETLEIHPSGKTARVRGLQRHGESVEELDPGSRCAINLQSIEVSDAPRGQVVARADSLVSTVTADLQLSWLASALETEGTISIEFLTGTSERRARLAPIGCAGFTPGSRSFARLHIDGDPLPLVAGDRFIARGFARSEGVGGTLGGGVVLDVAPPHRRRIDPDLLRELEIFSTGDAQEGLAERINRSGLGGMLAVDLAREMGLPGDVVTESLQSLLDTGRCMVAKSQRWLSSHAVARMEARLRETLEAFHRAEPLRPGMSRGALRGILPENVKPESAELAVRRLEDSGTIVNEGEYARLADFSPTLDGEAQAAVTRIREQAVAARLEPPSMNDWSQKLGISVERFRDLAAHLEREQALIRAPGDLFFDKSAIEGLRDKVTSYFADHDELDTQTYKDLIGTTRRTAMPLMELLDDLHVTRRMGDVRVQRKG